MNLYEVFYSYTEPCEECPDCLVEGSMEIEARSHNRAKAELRSFSTLHFKENFKVLRSKLLRQDTNRLERREEDSGKVCLGRATLLYVDGVEVVLVCPDANRLRAMARKIVGRDFKFRDDLVKKVQLREDKP